VSWYIAEQRYVKEIRGPNLPDADGKPEREALKVLAGYRQLLGIRLDR
jgi:hypothetical protein